MDRFAWAIFLKNDMENYEATHFSYDGEHLTFGLLINDSSVSTYFGDFLNDHALAFDLYAEEAFQQLAVSFAVFWFCCFLVLLSPW